MGLQIKTQVCRRVERYLSFLATPDPYYSRTFPNLYIGDRQAATSPTRKPVWSINCINA
jgi:hypothetical protein